MKLTLSVALLFITTTALHAQNRAAKTIGNTKPLIRCATMEHLEVWKRKTAAERASTTSANNRQQSTTVTSGKTAEKKYNLKTTVYVPVVFHIVLPDAAQVSDADVARQLVLLNTDFAGKNTDATDIPAGFKSLFGECKIQFKIARTDPSGKLTSGIERKNSSVKFDPNADTDNIKVAANGGLDAWDATKYYNVWVGDNTDGILGYGTFPGVDPNKMQGVVVNYIGFGSNPCYTVSSYGLGRTLVHETGHFFGLFHIWGDDDQDAAKCSGDDFRQLDGTDHFPTGLFNPAGQGNGPNDVGDTPNMASYTRDCPTGVATDSCSPDSRGRLYQDFMDYTEDPCYRMFTLKQVERMEYAYDNFRNSFSSSNTANPPAGLPTYDLAVSNFVNPGGSELIDCAVIQYPSETQCSSGLIPKVTITNNGTATITSFTATLSLNGTTAATVNVTNVSLATTQSMVVTFSNISPVAGNNTIAVTVSAPNGQTDQNTANNSLSTIFKASSSNAAPLVEGFEGTTFPPANWNIVQTPVDNITWDRSTFAAKTGSASAYLNSYNYESEGKIDALISPLVSFSNVDSVFIKFDIASASYNNPSSQTLPLDTLAVFISTDCGATYKQVYKKWGTNLVTVQGAVTTEFVPNANQWRTDSVNVTSVTGNTASIRVKFQYTENFNNNTYIDNVNIYTKTYPALLKQNGYLVYPNPTTGMVLVQHLVLPVNLKSINVYSTTGQLVYSQNIASPSTNIYVNLSNLASGLYVVRLIYSDKNVSQKIIKY
ncbi:choice-of-anchor J domain-containing protein [Danxiaibacter flavus]|uniref:Choice-of-anchor J domain-containing protein n=1 Tax=Danxiaibacter flavus TaxID=3049108 RepID=A0ABV3ZBZ6_9BACT|nr:choice-of-anchor J domain-containing protein [Chitinophagaceae bacterium DXS]